LKTAAVAAAPSGRSGRPALWLLRQADAPDDARAKFGFWRGLDEDRSGNALLCVSIDGVQTKPEPEIRRVLPEAITRGRLRS